MIRHAVPADAVALARLYGALMSSPTDPRRLRETLSRVEHDSRHHVLVVEDEATGDVLGTVYGAIVDDVVGEGRPFMVVDNLIVAAEARGSGLGRALMETAERLAREAHCTLIMLVSAEERAAAHHLYQRLGYDQPVRGFKKYL